MLKSRPDKEANCGNSVPAKQNAGRSSLKFLKSIYAQDAAFAYIFSVKVARIHFER